MKYVVLIIFAALTVSIGMSFLILWALRTFGMNVDYSWQSVAAVWITLAVVNSIAMRAKEY